MAEKQRPLGLKRTAAAAAAAAAPGDAGRAQGDDDPTGSASKRPKAASSNHDDDDEVAELELDVPLGEDGKPIDEIQEAHGIVEAALVRLEEGDEEQARTLLQGAVHEYDRFMRQRDEADRDSEFHRYYGDALRELGGLLGDVRFVEAALLRYDTALEKDPRNHQAHAALAKAHLELGRRADADAAMMTHVEHALACARAGAALAGTPTERARTLAQFALVVAEAAAARQPHLHAPVLEQAQAAFKEALELDARCAAGRAGLGFSLLSRADAVLYAESDDDDDDDDDAEEGLSGPQREAQAWYQQACVHLDAAIAAADPTTHDAPTRARYLAWLGQAWLGRGNLGEGDDAYMHALAHTRASAALDAAAVPDDVMAHLQEAAGAGQDDDGDDEGEEEEEEEEDDDDDAPSASA